MELLEKTRKINKLLQRGEKVEYNAIARLLRDVIGANIYDTEAVKAKYGLQGKRILLGVASIWSREKGWDRIYCLCKFHFMRKSWNGHRKNCVL